MPEQEIMQIKNHFVESLTPVRIYLFGSFAEGKGTGESDFDFYIVVKNEAEDIHGLTAKAYRAIRDVRTRPVDIIVGTERRFDERKDKMSIENEVFHKGVLLYGTEAK